MKQIRTQINKEWMKWMSMMVKNVSKKAFIYFFSLMIFILIFSFIPFLDLMLLALVLAMGEKNWEKNFVWMNCFSTESKREKYHRTDKRQHHPVMSASLSPDVCGLFGSFSPSWSVLSFNHSRSSPQNFHYTYQTKSYFESDVIHQVETKMVVVEMIWYLQR